MNGIRLASKMIITLTKDRMHYLDRLIADTLSLVARCGVLLLLYAYVFKLNGGIINGVTYDVVAWSMFFYFAFLAMSSRKIADTIAQDVKTGNIEILISKPVSYIAYRIWWQLGTGLYPFLVASVLGTLALALIIGIPSTMTIGIFLPTLFIIFIGAVILTLAIYVLVGLCAFWIEETTPIYWLVDKAVMILGGSYLPVALFPHFMYQLALYSPFGAALFVTHTTYQTWQMEWPLLMTIQFSWIIVFAFVIIYVFRKAKNKLSINGG